MSSDFLLSPALVPDTQSPGDISTPEGVASLLAPLSNRAQEHLVVITVGARRAAIGVHTVSIGIADSLMMHPREVFRPAIMDNAVSIILAHNHPSGDPTPSESDIEITRMLVKAGAAVAITVLDHVVVSAQGYVSLKDAHPDLFPYEVSSTKGVPEVDSPFH